MEPTDIAFIGGGNMARSLIGGLLANGWPAARIHVAEPAAAQHALLHQLDPGLQVGTDNRRAAAAAEVVVFAVKPQVLPAVARELAAVVRERQPLCLSIAAGVRTTDLARWLGGEAAIVRCMPNTPALVQSGATGLYATARVSEAQRARAESLLRAVGLTVWVAEEALLDVVTALSGSGPAYLFLLIEAMQQAAEGQGLPAETARVLALQTALGAARLALESSEPVAELRRRVTSPGGTTEAALAVFEAGDLRGLVARAMQAARDRAGELADELGRDE